MSEELKDANESESSTDTEEKAEPSQEGEEAKAENTPAPQPQPLHKEERFRKVYGRMKDLERQVQELSSKPEPKETPQPSGPPTWFSEAFGENPKLWAEYQNHSKSERESIKNELREELKREAEAENRAQAAAEKILTDQLDEMEEEGVEFDRNELSAFAAENPVVGADGNIDLRKSLNLMNRLKTAAPNAKDERKKISATGQATGPEPKPQEFFTDKDFANKGWGGLR